ncbi:unnamed protein product, partial [Musa textilis]
VSPFLSGLVVPLDDARHLRLDLSTAFTSNTSLRLSDHPNNAAALLSLVLKTGLGPLGSPDMGAPFSMVAEFSLLAGSGAVDPSFSHRLQAPLWGLCYSEDRLFRRRLCSRCGGVRSPRRHGRRRLGRRGRNPDCGVFPAQWRRRQNSWV